MAKTNQTPEIRFKGFTDPWEQRKLRDIAPLRGGFAFKSEEYTDIGIPIIRISNILSDGTVGAEFAYYTEQIDDEVYSLFDGAALLAMSGATTGKVSVLHVENADKYYQNQRVGYFTRQKEYDYKFVSTIVRSPLFTDQLGAVLVAGAQPNVSAKDIDSFEFMVPLDIKEQTEIGEFFRGLDNLITLHQRKLEKTQNFKRAMLEKMFPKNGESVPEIRFAGFTDPWEQRKLGELASFSRGNALSWSDISDNGQHECILYGNLYTDYGMIATDVKYKTNTMPNNPVFSQFGDVLIPGSDTTPTGLARATSIEKTGVLLGGDINIVRPNDGVDGSCLSLAINAQKSELIKLIKGITVRHIHNEDIKSVEVSLPSSISEQRKIVKAFKDLDNLITLHQRKLEKLQNIKKSMLAKMFA